MKREKLTPIASWLVVLTPVLILTGPAASDIALSLVSLFFLARSAILRDWTWLGYGWVKLVAALWLYIVVRGYVVGDWGPWQRSLGWFRFPLFAVALQHWLLTDATTRRRLLACLMATVGFLALDTLWQYAFGTDITGREALTFDGVALSRLTGPFSSPRAGVVLMWLMFPALLYAISQSSKRYRLLGFIGAALCMLAIVLTGERMATLLALTGFGAAFLLMPRLRPLMVGAGVLAIAAALLLGMQNPLLISRQYESTRDSIAGFWQTPYGETWNSALKISAAHPAMGIGPKQFRKECRKPIYGATDQQALLYRCPMHTHNIYLEWMVEHGAIGLGLFLLIILAWAKPVIGQWRDWKYDPVVTGLVITLGLRLWPINAQTSQFPAGSAVPFWLFAGWLLAELMLRRAKR